MELIRVSERVLYGRFEAERDRPNLAYVRGDRWSLAVDAGHSEAHVREFYRALEDAGLPLPEVTVLTHWHWDHTFGMHAVHGRTIASRRTDGYLRAARERIAREGTGWILALDPSVALEYAGGAPVTVVPADVTYEGRLLLDAGNVPAEVFEAPSPHTDDATLVYLPTEKLLILGDAPCGVFPTWSTDPAQGRKLIAAVEATGAELCLSGHWLMETRRELVDSVEAECRKTEESEEK